MKTLLVTTTYLIPEERFLKTEKFIKYYLDEAKVDWDILVLDNASPKEVKDKFILDIALPYNVDFHSFDIHFDRPSHLDYKYLWRACHFLQDLFEDYDKIIYCDNDFYILTKDMLTYINNINEGWHTFFCKKHSFNETGCYIVQKNCQQYFDFVNLKLEDFIKKYNNRTMESVLPVTTVNKTLKGDRHSEYGLSKPPDDADFSAQVTLEMDVKFK